MNWKITGLIAGIVFCSIASNDSYAAETRNNDAMKKESDGAMMQGDAMEKKPGNGTMMQNGAMMQGDAMEKKPGNGTMMQGDAMEKKPVNGAMMQGDAMQKK